MEMIGKKTWSEFQKSGLLWWVNRTLHLFGWAIVLQVELNGRISDVYPARVKFRGFDETSESEGFLFLTEYLARNAPELAKEVREN